MTSDDSRSSFKIFKSHRGLQLSSRKTEMMLWYGNGKGVIATSWIAGDSEGGHPGPGFRSAHWVDNSVAGSWAVPKGGSTSWNSGTRLTRRSWWLEDIGSPGEVGQIASCGSSTAAKHPTWGSDPFLHPYPKSSHGSTRFYPTSEELTKASKCVKISDREACI